MPTKKSNPKSETLAALRRKAKKKLREQTKTLSEFTTPDLKHLINELGTHEIELEIQNEELKRTRAELEASRDRLSDLYDFAPVGYLTLDTRGVIREINVACATLLGVNRRQLINMPFSAFLPDRKEQREFLSHFTEVIEKKYQQTCEVKLKRKSGPSFFAQLQCLAVEQDGRKNGLIRIAVVDISERKQAEETLRRALEKTEEEKNKSEAMIAAIADGISIQDKNFKVIYQNRLHRELIGGDHVGEYCYKAYRKKDAICEDCPLVLSFQDGKRHIVERTGLMGQRGEVTFELVASPLCDASGEVVSAVEVVRDITGRKQAEKDLRLFRTLIDQSNDCIFVVDPETGRLLDCNDRSCEKFGYTRREMLTLSVTDISVQLSETGAWKQRVEDIVKRGSRIIEGHHCRKDGSVFPVEINVVPVTQEGKQYLVAILRDISERKQTEDTLRRARVELESSRARYADLFDFSPVGYFLVDVRGRIREANLTGADMMGVARHLLTGEPFALLIEEDDLAVYEGHRKETFRSQTLQTCELRIKPKNAPVFYARLQSTIAENVDDKAGLIRIALIDVTARKRMEIEREKFITELQGLVAIVSRSQKQWSDTFDSIKDPIYITDAEYTVIKANKAFVEFTSMSFPAILGKKCHELIHESSVPYLQCPHRLLQETGNVADIELVDGKRKRTLIVSHFPYSTLNSAFGGSINIVRDVTQEREREMRFIMNERLASLGQMAASIAHEINNPLAAIRGCAEGLLNRVNQGHFEPALFKKYLEIVEEEIARCKNITTGMLSYVRKSSPEKNTIDVHETIDRTLEVISLQGRLKEVEVVKGYTQGDHAAYGNEGELRQVFLTVLTNALDAMGDKGTLAIETVAGVEAVEVMIRDSGSGIPSEQINRIFDPFFTTKADRGGTGLGLSITKKILVDHCGDIAVTSEVGKGTTFTITLPRH